MEFRTEDNPWKHKERVKWICCGDVMVAILGISYVSYRMFTFYIDIKDQEVHARLQDPAHVPFYYFLWAVVVMLYTFQIGTSYVLYSAVNLEATETDPYVSIQKCKCWLRCCRLLLLVVVAKICLEPGFIIYAGSILSYNWICILIGELVFRTAAIFGVKHFMQELQ